MSFANVLAIDTSLAPGIVAAGGPADRVADRVLPEAGEHARLLAAAVAEVVAEAGWRLADAEVVAVITGPGSFTGLRVGVATAKALAWATGSRLVGVSACEVIAVGTMAALGRAPVAVHVAFDAGRGDLFVTRVVPAAAAPSGWSVEPGRLVAAAEWPRSLPAGAVVSGPGLAVVAAALDARPDITIAPPTAWRPAADDLVRIAHLRAAAGAVDDPAALVPEYVRPSYADEQAGR
ncbi:MAG: tRNA threonylcarbamoyladenosine biosynthesis protein TsaB [Planctomycetota bacterium]|jgi:tRNA threonylcarbamoyladenosine biosynthesis protein TsaB